MPSPPFLQTLFSVIFPSSKIPTTIFLVLIWFLGFSNTIHAALLSILSLFWLNFFVTEVRLVASLYYYYFGSFFFFAISAARIRLLFFFSWWRYGWDWMCGLCYKKLGAFQVLEMETPSRKRFQKFFHRKVKDVFQKFQLKNSNFSLKNMKNT